MKKTIVKVYCDLCKEEKEVEEINYPVIFHTDQNEGRGCTPYVSQEKLEVCKDCLSKICVLHGWGAQGHNSYEISKEI